MSSLVIAFPKLEDARRIRDILNRHDIKSDAVCTTASQALAEMNELDGGIIICGYRLPDMFYADLRECMPDSFEMLLLASSRILGSCEDSGVISVSMPLSVFELVNTIQMMQHQVRIRKKKKLVHKRNKEEQEVLDHAKTLLMERNRMTESEAHRYIQKCSMDSGTNLVETAQMILTLMNC
ncbi:MAG: ANTAR domain-containing protein [Lachnospiraceae bacterium]|nr:ANTAR domain-containing protein [Lachnospiraceae bacterium]